MSFQIQAGKLKSHSGPLGSHALEGYITVSRNSDGFLSEREKKGSAMFWLTSQEGADTTWAQWNKEDRLIQVNTSTDISHMATRGCCQVLVSLLPVSYKPCPQTHRLLILQPRKVQLKMFCGLSPQGNHVLAFVDNMQVSTLVNLLSTHTTQATSQSRL